MPGYCSEVGANEAMIIPPYRLHASRRERRHDRHDALFIGADLIAGFQIQQAHIVAIHRHARATQFGGRFFDAMCNRENRPAGFSLPVIVDYWPANPLGDPLGGWLIQRLASEEKSTQRGSVVFGKEGRGLAF